MTDKKKAIIYTRVTQPKNQSDKTQMFMTKKWLTERDDIEVVNTYSDVKSGSTLNRKGLNAMFDEIKSGDIDYILMYRPEALTTNVYDLCDLVSELRELNVLPIFVYQENIGIDTPEKLIHLQMITYGNHAECINRSVKLKGMAEAERERMRGL